MAFRNFRNFGKGGSMIFVSMCFALLTVFSPVVLYGGGTFIPSLNATVVSLRFHHSDKNMLPFGKRTYHTQFSTPGIQYINWELEIEYPKPDKKIYFEINAVYYNQNDIAFGQHTLQAYIESTWTRSFHSSGWGSEDGNFWKTGNYKLELSIGSQKVATGYFLVSPAGKGPAKVVPDGPGKKKAKELPDDLGEL